MLDGPTKPRLGALLQTTQTAWKQAVGAALEQRNAPALGAGMDLLA
jgi:hypothetical protein